MMNAQNATYLELSKQRPEVALLPWGATEAHNFHLPQGTDTMQATALAEAAARLASQRGARVVVLPAIPYGNNAQQLDQICTVHFRTETAAAILRDVVKSLCSQNIRKLLILNSHGGNEFKPLVRDLQHETGSFIAVANWYAMCPELVAETIENPGDHADELETSMMLHLHPELVRMKDAGEGKRIPFRAKGLSQPGVWTPRPWSRCHPDTGSGNPSLATAEKGRVLFETISQRIAGLLVDICLIPLQQLP